MTRKIIIAGVMTGTSCDALDCAFVEFTANNGTTNWKPVGFLSTPYPKLMRERILQIQNPKYKGSIKNLFEIHRDLGKWYASTLKKLIQQFESTSHDKVLAIANHGQTVAHYPEAQISVQLGDSAWIANETGLTTISNFRSGDLAGGGQGAPLVPLFHRELIKKIEADPVGVSIHNLGGVSNLSYFGPKDKIIAFDTGPANFWIDGSVHKITQGKKKFDQDGALAKQGTVDLKTLRRWMSHSFFKLPPPKSTGRDDFPLSTLFQSKLKGVDLVSTASALTVESIGQAYESFILKKKLPLKKIIFCGGGAKNKFLLEWLSDRLYPVEISTLENYGFDSQQIEAQAFAYFGYLSLRGESLGGEWTGVKKPSCSGQIYLSSSKPIPFS